MIPNSRTIQEALIDLLTHRGPTRSSDAYRLLREPLQITKSDLKVKTSDGKSKYEYMVRWAKKALVDSGRLKTPDESGRGLWELKSPSLPCETSEELERAIARLGAVRTKPNGQRRPKTVTTTTKFYIRDAFVAAYVLTLADGTCEACNEPSPFFRTNGMPYLEVHHVRHLADHGTDTAENTVGVCPNCHKELHYGRNAEAVKKSLYNNVTRLVRE